MTTSSHLEDMKVNRFERNITKRGACLKQPRERERTILLVMFSLDSSCLLSLDHLYSRKSGHPQPEPWLKR
ncbi:hypothetical protein IMY05_003G0127500 [Salix suchowensis]|nr:hypothetical protein IMY05_003G0127500 [Salix suchowensis]